MNVRRLSAVMDWTKTRTSIKTNAERSFLASISVPDIMFQTVQSECLECLGIVGEVGAIVIINLNA
jgi:hypothetical protein